MLLRLHYMLLHIMHIITYNSIVENKVFFYAAILSIYFDIQQKKCVNG